PLIAASCPAFRRPGELSVDGATGSAIGGSDPRAFCPEGTAPPPHQQRPRTTTLERSPPRTEPDPPAPQSTADPATTACRASPEPPPPAPACQPSHNTSILEVLRPPVESTQYLAIRYTERLAERSEEHTSELQSRENLVCRLLLEK